MKLKILTLVSLLGLYFNSLGCSCDWNGPFINSFKDSEIVAKVKILKYMTYKRQSDGKKPMSIEVEILEVWKGKEQRKIIKIWGDNGILCRPYIDEFKIGSTMILALDQGNEESGNKKEKKTDYSISICGEYWLEVNDEEAIGVISNDEEYKHDENNELIRNNQNMQVTDLKTLLMIKN